MQLFRSCVRHVQSFLKSGETQNKKFHVFTADGANDCWSPKENVKPSFCAYYCNNEAMAGLSQSAVLAGYAEQRERDKREESNMTYDWRQAFLHTRRHVMFGDTRWRNSCFRGSTRILHWHVTHSDPSVYTEQAAGSLFVKQWTMSWVSLNQGPKASRTLTF